MRKIDRYLHWLAINMPDLYEIYDSQFQFCISPTDKYLDAGGKYFLIQYHKESKSYINDDLSIEAIISIGKQLYNSPFSYSYMNGYILWVTPEFSLEENKDPLWIGNYSNDLGGYPERSKYAGVSIKEGYEYALIYSIIDTFGDMNEDFPTNVNVSPNSRERSIKVLRNCLKSYNELVASYSQIGDTINEKAALENVKACEWGIDYLQQSKGL